jgi:hypothetical protein
MTWSATTAGLWTALAIAMLPAVARAQPVDVATPGGSSSGLSVGTSGCSGFQTDRIERLLRLELATLVPTVAELPPLNVDFLCTGADVRVTLGDSVTGKWVAREVTLRAAVDRERTLALVASELFLASWAELLLQTPEGPTKASEPIVVAAKRAVERAAPSRPSPPTMALDLLAIGRERHLASPLPTLGGAIRVGQANDERWQFFADIGWEAGATERASGRVDISATAAGMGARLCWHFASVELGLTGSASAVYVSLQGIPSSASFFGARHTGFTAEVSGGLEANVKLEMVRVGGAISGGAIAPGPVGRVDGGTPVRFDGAWAGVTLFAGLLL